HEPARLVGADRDRGEVEAAEARADVCEIPGIARVAGEEERKLGMAQHPAAPERAVLVGQRALGPVLHRDEMDFEPLEARALPPAQLDHVFDSLAREPVLEAERHKEPRRAAGLRRELSYAVEIEVVVV